MSPYRKQGEREDYPMQAKKEPKEPFWTNAKAAGACGLGITLLPVFVGSTWNHYPDESTRAGIAVAAVIGGIFLGIVAISRTS